MNEKVTIEGKCGIKATIIADSINEMGDRLTTFELEYPRFIHSEVMTHRMLSKNSASSRAIPFGAMIELIAKNPAMPVFWGKNQSGMQAKEELSPEQIEIAKSVWLHLMETAISGSKILNNLKLHKQILNRVNEPWQMMKTVMTGTEFRNLFWLRNHSDAQPEFHELGWCMETAYDSSQPVILTSDQWHLPYVDTDLNGYPHLNGKLLSIEDALKLSSSCCAQVSYRKMDDSLDKAIDIYNKLIESEPCHASPVEHQATPINFGLTDSFDPETWAEGITHVRRDGTLWSGNLRGWIQHRQLIPNSTKW